MGDFVQLSPARDMSFTEGAEEPSKRQRVSDNQDDDGGPSSNYQVSHRRRGVAVQRDERAFTLEDDGFVVVHDPLFTAARRRADEGEDCATEMLGSTRRLPVALAALQDMRSAEAAVLQRQDSFELDQPYRMGARQVVNECVALRSESPPATGQQVLRVPMAAATALAR